MQRNTGLRDPFATDDIDEMSSSGRPPPRLPRTAQTAPSLRNLAESSTSGSLRYTGTLGAPRSASSRTPSNNAEGVSSNSAPPRSLGLSLGMPPSRMAAQRVNNDGEIPSDPSSTAASGSDDAVRNTDSDALLSRLSALKLGYLPPEPFTQEFSTSCQSQSAQQQRSSGLSASSFPRPHQPDAPARRSPLINIGTYLRCTAIDAEVQTFLKHGVGPKQIISIGAGSDSRYWRIMSDPDLSKHLHHYVEIDFAENTSQKLNRILRSSVLRSSLDSNSIVHGVPLSDLPSSSSAEEASPSEAKRLDVLRSTRYTLLAADVRQLHPDTATAERIDSDHLFTHSTGLNPELPTLILFECVLAYITPDKADWLIRHLGERFANVQAVSYDIALAGDAGSSWSGPTTGVGIDRDGNVTAASSSNSSRSSITPSRFGRVMLQNLEMRKLSLPGAKAYPTIQAQSERFVRAWSLPTEAASTLPHGPNSHVDVCGRSLFQIWSHLAAEQKSRLSRLEGLDEVEEIDMLLKHYCIIQARRRV
ncbi:related to PPM1 |uniref:Leucine carboxyl methyltransferase 1 n=1 Tax=Ustilago trichophora TaxID=86804 RepID=A0A5C3E2Y9_9BASI|nr:related to PPM1 \